jgi:CheY-like chemotaxis protein
MEKQSRFGGTTLDLARVLLVDDDPATRLTLRTVLEAGGYRVDSATNTAEAFDKMDHAEYQLVLSDLQMESPESGLEVLAHARMMDYRPATAIVTAYFNSCPHDATKPILVETEDVPTFLGQIATLIGRRVNSNLALSRRN